MGLFAVVFGSILIILVILFVWIVTDWILEIIKDIKRISSEIKE